MRTHASLGALLCLLLSVSALAEPCESMFGSSWRDAFDGPALEITGEFLPKMSPKRFPYICEGTDEQHHYAMTIAYSFLSSDGSEVPVLFIAIDSRLRPMLSHEHLRVLIAHEIAHYASGMGMLCNKIYSLRGMTQCESLVDKDAAKWTSKKDMISLLQFLITLPDPLRPTPEAVTEMQYRIKELQEWRTP